MILFDHSNLGSTSASAFQVSEAVGMHNIAFSAARPSSAPPPPVSSGEAKVTGATLVYNIRDTSRWSHTKEQEFSRLAALKARGKATGEELAELSRLRQIRRKKKNPLSAEEVLFQYRRRQMEAKLLEEIQEYVAFIEAPRPAKA